MEEVGDALGEYSEQGLAEAMEVVEGEGVDLSE